MGEKVKLKQSTSKPVKGRGKREQNLLLRLQPPLVVDGSMQVPSLRTPYCHLCAMTADLKPKAGFRAATHKWNKQMQPEQNLVCMAAPVINGQLHRSTGRNRTAWPSSRAVSNN